MVITDLPVNTFGPDRCAACVAGKSVRGRAGGYLELVHIDIAVPMPVSLAGGREYLYVVMDGYTHAICTRGKLSGH